MVEGGGSVRMDKILVRFKGFRILPPSSQGHLPNYFQTINRHINEYIHKLRISIYMHAAKKRFSKIAKLLPNDESSPFAPPGALRAPQEFQIAKHAAICPHYGLRRFPRRSRGKNARNAIHSRATTWHRSASSSARPTTTDVRQNREAAGAKKPHIQT